MMLKSSEKVDILSFIVHLQNLTFSTPVQAFLTRVAKSQQGALELLRSGVIVRLAQCQVYDMRPETDHQG